MNATHLVSGKQRVCGCVCVLCAGSATHESGTCEHPPPLPPLSQGRRQHGRRRRRRRRQVVVVLSSPSLSLHLLRSSVRMRVCPIARLTPSLLAPKPCQNQEGERGGGKEGRKEERKGGNEAPSSSPERRDFFPPSPSSNATARGTQLSSVCHYQHYG